MNKTENVRHEVYECKVCKAHYLELVSVYRHLKYRHEMEGPNLIEKVPFGATEFD